MKWTKERYQQECLTWALLLLACVALCFAAVAAAANTKWEALLPLSVMGILCGKGLGKQAALLEKNSPLDRR